MVYMAGDNDLDSFCWTDLAELRKVGSNDHLNIWAARNYPARRYLMGFWNHGSGVDESDVYARTRGGRRSPES